MVKSLRFKEGKDGAMLFVDSDGSEYVMSEDMNLTEIVEMLENKSVKFSIDPVFETSESNESLGIGYEVNEEGKRTGKVIAYHIGHVYTADEIDGEPTYEELSKWVRSGDDEWLAELVYSGLIDATDDEWERFENLFLEWCEYDAEVLSNRKEKINEFWKTRADIDSISGK
ncbi:MAG: hypothetical protein V9H25_06510 [Candidatus Competibacter sp.]